MGITVVFVILWLCGHLYRALHGRRGSWMQLQLPFLTLTNSYLALLTHSFWPSEAGNSMSAGVGNTQEETGGAMDDEEGQAPRSIGQKPSKGLLDDDYEDD